VVELRDKVRRFGLHVIPQILDRSFDRQNLLNLKNAGLLELCLKLSLITDQAFSSTSNAERSAQLFGGAPRGRRC
jgi:hypothetical protein